GLIARREWKIGQILLRSIPLQQVPDAQIADVLTDIIRIEGKNLLNFNEDVEQWQSRILSIKQWDSDTAWPDVSTSALLACNKEWLVPYLTNIRKNEDLKRIDLKEILHYYLPYELRLKLEECVPEKIQVPSGSFIRLKYFSDGSQPVLAVRLQECFGLIDTPRICNGRIPVLMHLLSPGFKPVQITSDLNSFWKNTYFDVRKDLKRRYPKHSWPDEPMNETPLQGVRRKKV
ncbi:MAG: ATP-dependent helicase C-terminal domain-containing protein, partial [Bacteroidales bacterium]